MASSMITAAAVAAATASASSAATADELKGVEEDDVCRDEDVDEEDGGLNASSSLSCANDPEFAVICVFLQKFHKDLGVAKPNFKHLQEWLTNTDDVSEQLRLLHIKLLRKTRKIVHEKSWESSLSKFCFTYSAQDAWEIERFGYKKSSLKVKLRILRELLESQFQRNAKFRAQILTKSADSLRSQPIGRDRLGHTYYFTQDDDANLRIYQEHLDEEIWQVVATTREELVNLISRLRGNEVVLPSTDIGVDEDTSSSNSGTALLEKPAPPVEQDDSQEEETRVPNLRIKFTSNNGKVTVSSPTLTTPSIATKRNLEEMEKSSPLSEELNIIKKARPSLLDINRAKKPSRYEKTKSEDEDEEGEEDDDDEEDDEEELSIEEEDIDSAAAEEDENEEKDIEEDSQSDVDGENEVGDSIEDPPLVIRGEGSGKDCEGGNMIFSCNAELFDEDIHIETESDYCGEAVEEETLYVYGEGSGAECLVGNGKNDDAGTATTAAKAATPTPTPTTPTKTNDTTATFFFGEPGCLKLSPIKPTPLADKEKSKVDDVQSNKTDNQENNQIDEAPSNKNVQAIGEGEIKEKGASINENNSSSQNETNENLKSVDVKNSSTDELDPVPNDDNVEVTSNGEDIGCSNKTMVNDVELDSEDINEEKCDEKAKNSEKLGSDEKLKESGGSEVKEKLQTALPDKLKESMKTVADAEICEVEENVILEKIKKSEGNASNKAREESKAVETTNVQRMEKGKDRVTESNVETKIENIASEVLEKDNKITADKKPDYSQKKTVQAKQDQNIEKEVDEKLGKQNKEIAEDSTKERGKSAISAKLESLLESVANKKLEKSTKDAANTKVSEVNVEATVSTMKPVSSKDELTKEKIQPNEEEGNIAEKKYSVQEEGKAMQKNDMDHKHVGENKVDGKAIEAKELKNENEKTCIINVPGGKNINKAKEIENNMEANVETLENIVGSEKLDEMAISQRSKTGESENGVYEKKQQQTQKTQEQKEQKQKNQENKQNAQKQPQDKQQQQTELTQHKDQKQQPAPEESKIAEDKNKFAEQMANIGSGENTEEQKLSEKSIVEYKSDSTTITSTTIVSAQPIAKPSNSTSTFASTQSPLSIVPTTSNPMPVAIPLSVSIHQTKSFPPCTSNPTTHSIVNRKRRLDDMPPPPTAQRLSTSESEVDLQSEQQEEFAAPEDDLDPAGKRLKMRPKLTNIEVRKKVEAQKGCIEETTSSSGEEDARRRRKIIPQRRQIERCVKNLKVAQEAAAAKRESSLAQTLKEGENAVPLVIEKEAMPLNLTSPTTMIPLPPAFPVPAPLQSSFVSTASVQQPPAVVKISPPAATASLSAVIPTVPGSVPLAPSTSKLTPMPSSATVPKAGHIMPTIRQKPTLAEIIEKKLKKTCETVGGAVLGDTSKAPIALSMPLTTTPVTQNTGTKDSNIIASYSPPKKSPITKPLKKNLLTQLRQEESDEESIPRKRTISDASAATPPAITITATPAIKTEIVKKLESFFVEDHKEQVPERKITPERKLAQTKTSDRKSVDRKLPTRKMPERKTPDRRVADHKSPERKQPERKTPERKTPDRQRKRRSSEEVKAAGKIEVESNKEMKYETLDERETKVEKLVIKNEKSPSPLDTTVETEVAGRRSSRRSAASVVYAELPQPKRTRAGAKVMSITIGAATPAATTKKPLVKEGKTGDTKCEVNKVEDSVKAGDKRVATLSKETALTCSAKEENTAAITEHANTTVTVKPKEISKESAKEPKKSKQTPKGTKATKKDSKKEGAQNLDDEPIHKQSKVPAPSVKATKVSTTHITTPVTPTPSAGKISPPSAKITPPDKNTSDSTPTSSARGRGMRSKLEVDATNILQTIDSETPVRQSRRIAQQKIREEAERRKLEEIALRTMKQELKKKKKAEKQSDPTVVEPSEPSSSDESEVELKKKAKKKCPGKDGWSSGSEEQEEPEEDDEPAQESDPGSPLFRSDHEFSPESELEDDTLVVPMKRARTARKEDAEDGEEPDEHACQKCGKSDHPEWILLCDNCDKGYHCSCLSPVLFYIPEGDWYCPPCQQEQLIAALEKQLNDFDEYVEQKRVQEEENKRLAAEAERVAKERLENEMQQQKEDKERKKQLKKIKQRNENGKEGDDDDASGGSASSDGAAGEDKNKKRAAKESEDDSEDDKPLVRVKSTGNRKIQRDSHKRHKRRRGDGGRRRRRAAARGIASRRRQRNTSDSGTGSGSAHGTRSGSDGSSDSGSSSSSSSSSLSDSDDEPIYKLRKRRQINVSYRLNEYDDLINSALKKEMDAAAGAGNLGRGKDISTIIDADKETTRQRQIEEDTEVDEDKEDKKAEKAEKVKVEQDDETKEEEDDKAKVEKVDDRKGKDEETKKKKDEANFEKEKDKKAVKAQDSQSQKEKKSKEESNDDSESSDEILKRRAKPKPTPKKKKPRKLTTLDISSEEDNASDEDFKTSSFEDDEEDTSISASTASDSSLEVFRRRGKKNKKKRKAARRANRQRRKDRRFVVNDSDDDEEEDRPKTKKKRKDDTDYTATDTDSEVSENLEDVDSADLCDDTTSESDGAWYPSKRKKQRKGNTSVAVARKSPKLKKQPVKKSKKVEYSDDDITESEEEEDDDDDINCGKGSGKQPRSQPLIPSKSSKGKGKGKGKGKPSNSKKKKKKQSEDEDDSFSDSDDSTRRTRGRRYAYLDDFEDDSSDGGIKPGVQRPDTPPEERQKFIQRQEEIKRMLAEKNAEGAKLAATPRLTPIKADGDKEKRSPAKLSDSLSTVPLSVIRQAKVLDADYLQRKGESIGGDLDHVDEVDEFDDADLPDDFPDDMDEDTIARMVEEEEELSAAAAARELPPPDEVLRTPTKQASNKQKEASSVQPAPSAAAAPPNISAAVASAAAVANLTASASAANAHSSQKPSHHINPSLAALAQMPGGVSTAAAAAAAAAAVHHMSSMSSGLQEPMRKRLPMPTMHPPLLRHQFPPHGTNMPLAHLLQRHPSAPPPPTHLLQNALNTPLGQPLNRNNFPPQHLPRLPAGMSMEQMLAAQHIMSAAAAARHNLPPTSQPLASAPGTRDSIQNSSVTNVGSGGGSSSSGGGTGSVAAAIAAATAVAAASGANKPQSEPKPRGRRKKITPLRDTLQKQQTAAAVTAATTQSDKTNEPPTNNGAGGSVNAGGVIKSVVSATGAAPPPPQLYKQQSGAPSVSSAPVSQASVITRMPQHSAAAAHASIARAMSNLYSGADVARFFAPPTSLASVAGPRPPHSMQRHRDSQGMPGLPHPAGMRQSYGPPPPLRGSAPNHGQPTHVGAGDRQTYHAPGDLHMPSGMGASMYGGPPPPARHSTSHLNPYRPPIYGNPNFMPRGPGVPNLRVPGSGGPEFPGGPRSYAPYGYYPPPPPLTNPHAPPMQRHPPSSTGPARGISGPSLAAPPTTPPSTASGVSSAPAHSSTPASITTAANTKTNVTTTITAKPSSVIVSAPPSNAGASIHNVLQKTPIPTPTITKTPTAQTATHSHMQTPTQTITPKATTSIPISTSANTLSIPSRVIVTESAGLSAPIAAIVNNSKGVVVTTTATPTVINEASQPPRKKLTTLETYAVTQTKSPLVMAGESSGSRSSPGDLQADAADDSSSAQGTSSTAVPADSGEGQASEFSGLVSYFSSQHDDYNT